jgi:hypothetical protein
MRKVGLFGFTMALLPIVAQAAISLHLAANSSAPSLDTRYPNGDRPNAGCTVPSGWTEISLGDGGGEICEQSATEFYLNVSGSSQSQNNHLVHKDAGAADVQLEARITNTYAGSADNNASTGVGLREAATQDAYIFQCHSLQGGAAAVQLTYGAAGSYTNVNGAAGQARPRYVAVTYDLTSGALKCHESADGSAWSEVGGTNRAMSDVIGYVFGASKSAVATLQATLDNIWMGSTIDAYTPSDPGGGPTLVTPIPNQSAAQGTPFSLSIAENFSGQTSYTATGFPGAGGFTFNTATGAVAGTPDSDDVAASPFNVDFCGRNGVGPTCDISQFTVSAVPGDTLVVTSGTATVDCDTYEGGGVVDPGDILEIAGGVRGPLTILDCHGTPSNPIIIRNDVTDNEAATIRRTTGSAPALELVNLTNWKIDGMGKFVGADSGVCGYTQATGALGTTQCGVVVETTGGTGGFVIRMNGTTCAGTVLNPQFCEIKGLKINGGNVSGAGLSMNDHAVAFLANDGGSGTDDDLWRENITVSNNYMVDVGNTTGEGMYLGPNQDAVDPDLPLRNIAVRNNYILNPARDCINTKSVLDGNNILEYNYLVGCGQAGETTQNRALNLNGAAGYEIRGNVALDVGGEGLLMTWQDIANLTPGTPTFTVLIENEIYANVGLNPGSANDGAKFTRNSSAQTPGQSATMRNVTIATTDGNGVTCGSSTTVTVSNSILAGLVGTAVSGCSSSNNRTGTVAAQNFVNAAADNYELTSSSPACNSATANSPDFDYEGEARPQDSADDQGADEATACP